jgi:ribosomal protein L22
MSAADEKAKKDAPQDEKDNTPDQKDAPKAEVDASQSEKDAPKAEKDAPKAKKDASQDGQDNAPDQKDAPKAEVDAPQEAPKRRRPRKKAAAGKEPSAKQSASPEDSAAESAKAAGESPKEPVAARSPSRKRSTSAERAGRRKEKRPAPRRGGAKRTPTRRVVRARARYVRTSARKARMICGQLRGKSVPEARAILAFTPREVARAWSKLLESAVANAESNHELLEDDLIVREAYADEGPTIRRFRPRAMGRATTIRKRTSHLTITLAAGSQTGTTKR